MQLSSRRLTLLHTRSDNSPLQKQSDSQSLSCRDRDVARKASCVLPGKVDIIRTSFTLKWTRTAGFMKKLKKFTQKYHSEREKTTLPTHFVQI